MFMIIIQSILISIILLIMIILLNFFSKKTFMDREKTSPFECGFDPKNSARLPFSIQFFLIAMIFVIFDVELTLLLPSIYIIKYMCMENFTFSMYFFLTILIFGLLHEKKEGSLNWKK